MIFYIASPFKHSYINSWCNLNIVSRVINHFNATKACRERYNWISRLSRDTRTLCFVQKIAQLFLQVCVGLFIINYWRENSLSERDSEKPPGARDKLQHTWPCKKAVRYLITPWRAHFVFSLAFMTLLRRLLEI
jgi:hypothetical protein